MDWIEKRGVTVNGVQFISFPHSKPTPKPKRHQTFVNKKTHETKFVYTLQCDARSGTNGAPNHTEYLMKTVYYAECCHRRHQYLALSMCLWLCSQVKWLTTVMVCALSHQIQTKHTATVCVCALACVCMYTYIFNRSHAFYLFYVCMYNKYTHSLGVRFFRLRKKTQAIC